MYKRIPVSKLTGDEQFKNTSQKKFSILEFWQYGFSSLNSNVLRGVIAEFIVENALKEKSEIEVRSPWGDFDVLYKAKKIEVKCTSYIQDWDQNKLKPIKWSNLRAKKLYYSEAVTKLADMDPTKDYKADIYILSLFKHQEHSTLDILDMNQWCFYVLTKEQLREFSGNRASISLSRLKKFNHEPVSFEELAGVISSDTI